MDDRTDDWVELDEDVEMDPHMRRVQRIFLAGTIICFAGAILAIVGELLDWWDALGEAMGTTATVGGLLLGTFTLLARASGHQVATVRSGVRMTNANLARVVHTLDSMDHKLGGLARGDQLDVVTAHLNQQTGILVQIRDRL